MVVDAVAAAVAAGAVEPDTAARAVLLGRTDCLAPPGRPVAASAAAAAEASAVVFEASEASVGVEEAAGQEQPHPEAVLLYCAKGNVLGAVSNHRKIVQDFA